MGDGGEDGSSWDECPDCGHLPDGDYIQGYIDSRLEDMALMGLDDDV
jgi:hypothetical protein